MSASRFLLYSLVLLLALLLAGAIYTYQRLPAILEQQAEAYLYEYGVRDVEIGTLRTSLRQLQIDRLRLSGARDGLAFDVALSFLQADFELHEVWRGSRPALSLAGLDVSLRQTGPAADEPASPLVISEWLPHELLADLPLAALDVREWRVDYQAHDTAPVTAAGSLRWTGHLDLPFAASMPGSEVTGTLRSAPGHPLQLELQWLTGDSRLAGLAAAARRVEPHRWEWSLGGDLQYAPLLAWLRGQQQDPAWPLDLSAVSGLALTGASEFEGIIGHPDALLWSPAAAPVPAALFDGTVSIVNSISQLASAGSVEAVTGTVPVSLDLSAGGVQLTVGPAELGGLVSAATLGLPADTRRWLRWGATVPWHWRMPTRTRLAQTASGAWSLQLEDNRLLLGSKSTELAFEGIDLAVLLAAQQVAPLETTFRAGVNIRLRQKALPQLQLSLEQRGSMQRSEFELVFGDTTQSLEMSLAGGVDLDSGHGAYRAELRSLDLPYASGMITPLLQKFDLLPQPVELLGGSFGLSSDLQSTGFSLEQLEQQAMLRVEGLSGSYGEYSFEGVELFASWTGIEEWRTLQPASFAMARLDVGFDITDTRATVLLPRATPLRQPVVRVDSFEAGMFGGRVYLPEPGSWDFGRATNSAVLRAENWRLANLVALQQGEDIMAEGLLEGELPVTVSEGRILIERGYLRARAPGGRIVYNVSAAGSALGQSSPELGLALGLLEDFRYQTLSSEVQLDREGNLLLGLSLSGSNPAHYDGRSIRFNINLEQNLDPLLQSLRLSDRLVEEVEQRIQ